MQDLHKITIEQLFEVAKTGEAVGLPENSAKYLSNRMQGSKLGLKALGVVLIAGISYFLFKKVKSAIRPQTSTNLHEEKEEKERSVCSSDILSINSQQIELLQSAYTCSISQELMTQPVFGNCCPLRNYERTHIERWIEKHQNCPFCRRHLKESDLSTNHPLKIGIEVFRGQLNRRAKKMLEKRMKTDGL